MQNDWRGAVLIANYKMIRVSRLPCEFFFQVAINFLMRILRDPSLSSYHKKVVGALVFIFKVGLLEGDVIVLLHLFCPTTTLYC